MTNAEFVDFCYRQILRRQADLAGKAGYLQALDNGSISRESVLMEFVTSPEFDANLGSAEFVPAGHFFSAIPSLEEKAAFLKADLTKPVTVLGINFNTQNQLDLLDMLRPYAEQCPFPEHKTAGFRYYFDNSAYCHGDGLILHSMIRHFQPQRIIEIGSGFSSCAMLDTSDRYFQGEIEVTLIEPYPALLQSLIDTHSATSQYNLMPTRLQEVDGRIFETLEENDILFIDSTHVSKLNSDVNKIFFEILPALKKGVLIHFHDVFWPFEYPKEWIEEGRAWNEIYLLRAFLEFNQGFEVVLFSNYLYQQNPRWFEVNMPLLLKNPGGNLWLRKLVD